MRQSRLAFIAKMFTKSTTDYLSNASKMEQNHSIEIFFSPEIATPQDISNIPF